MLNKVKVYKNLTRNTWSIQDYKTRKVIGYSDNIKLKDARFVVSETGRQRVLNEKKKYVHAFVVGTMVDNLGIIANFEQVKYNPYVCGSFYNYASNPVSEDWRGAVHLFRDQETQRLTVEKEIV